MIYRSSAWDFPQGSSLREAMWRDPAARACSLPLVICVSLWETAIPGFKITLTEAEGGQW